MAPAPWLGFSLSLASPLTCRDAEGQQRPEQDQRPGPSHGSLAAQARGPAGVAQVFLFSLKDVFMLSAAGRQGLPTAQPHFLL